MTARWFPRWARNSASMTAGWLPHVQSSPSPAISVTRMQPTPSVGHKCDKDANYSLCLNCKSFHFFKSQTILCLTKIIERITKIIALNRYTM